MIERAIFVLTGPDAGQVFLRALPDLRTVGLEDATILHPLPGKPGRTEPMSQLASWVRHFEATLERAELAIKRGDPIRWTSELARVRRADLIVLCVGVEESRLDVERMTSELRSIGVPALYLPRDHSGDHLFGRPLIGVKRPETLDSLESLSEKLLAGVPVRAVHVAASDTEPRRTRRAGIQLEVTPTDGSVARTLLQKAEAEDATVLGVLSGEEESSAEAGGGLAKSLVVEAERPVVVVPVAH